MVIVQAETARCSYSLRLKGNNHVETEKHSDLGNVRLNRIENPNEGK